MIINGTLQPYVWQSLKWAEEKTEKRINSLRNKKSKTKNSKKIIKIDNELNELNYAIENLHNW